MKILQIGPVRCVRARTAEGNGQYVGPGTDGLGHSIIGLSVSLAELGHKIGLMTSRPSLANDGHAALREVLPKSIDLIPGPESFHRNPFAISSRWIDSIVTRFGEPDVVHFHGLYVPFQEALARTFSRFGWKYIVAPRGSLSQYSQRKSRVRKVVANRLFIRGYIERATAVHALTGVEACDVRRFSPSSEVVEIPNGIDERTIRSIARLGAEPIDSVRRGDLILGYVGRMEIGIKGIDLMLDAILDMQTRDGRTGFKFLFVGPLSSGRRKDDVEAVSTYLAEAMRRLPFPQEVEFVGPRFGEDKWRFLNALDVYFQVSRTEGMSNSVVEALAAGKPCLLTESTNMGDLLRTADCGWICQAERSSICEALRKLRTIFRDEIRRKGEAGRQYALQNLTWQNLARRYELELKRLVSSRERMA